MGATTKTEGGSLSRSNRKFVQVTTTIARWQSICVLSRLTPNIRRLRSRKTNRTIWILLPTDDTPLDPPQCIVHAEHEILIFLYFE